MDLDLFKMRVFVAIVETGGYTSAARRLGLSQSTVSSHLAKLEHQLGTQLLLYENRNIRLSAVGKQVYEVAKHMLQEQDQLVDLVRTRHSAQIRFGASIAFEQDYFFKTVIAPFYKRDSTILLSIWFGHSLELAERVLCGDLDLGLILAWKIPAGLQIENEGPAIFKFLVSTDHHLAGQVVSPEMIASAGIIAAPLDSLEWSYYARVLAELNLTPSDVSLEISGIQARMIAARQGLGVVGVFYPHYGSPDKGSGLVELELDRPYPVTDIVLIRARKGPVNLAAAELATWIRSVSLTKNAKSNEKVL